MKNIKSKKAFTMIELVFVIVIIGILAAVAIPRLSATRDDAEIAKARTVVASVRNALAMERQKRILRGDFTLIDSVSEGEGSNVFDRFSVDGRGNNARVMEYPIKSEPNKQNRWSVSGAQYTFKSVLGDVAFQITDGRFVCVDESSHGCKQLTN